MRFIYLSFHENALLGKFAQKGLPECLDGCPLFQRGFSSSEKRWLLFVLRELSRHDITESTNQNFGIAEES